MFQKKGKMWEVIFHVFRETGVNGYMNMGCYLKEALLLLNEPCYMIIEVAHSYKDG